MVEHIHKVYVLDCTTVKSMQEFWELYLRVVSPEGEQYFGCNPDAFRDAVLGGGPGWPGACTLEIRNIKNLENNGLGSFVQILRNIVNELGQTSGVVIKLT